jgi:FdhD protein
MFEAEGRGIDTDFRIKPEKIFSLVKQLNSSMELYKTSGGVHASALANHERILSIAEDIGRHNTFDKIQGECLKKNILTRDCIVITTGRISSEMLLKASRMGLPVVVSMKSPTGNAVAFAEKLNITLIGKAKGEKIVVYTNAHRLKEH